MTKPLEGSILEVLQGRLRPVLSRRAGLALGVWGEAGSGKTHTLRQLLRQTTCRSFSLHATTPAAKLAQALPRSAKLPLWAEILGQRLAGGEPLDGGRAAEAVAALLAALAPVVLHLEDLHEADERQLEFVRALARRAGRQRGLALLVTSRERPPEGLEALRLGPLPEAELRAALEGEVGAPLPAEALGWIGARAGGNPLYALEFLRFLARQGALWNDGQRWRWRAPERRAMPASVEALIERALGEAARSPELVQALEVRAVLGPGEEGLWAGLLGLTPEALAALTEPLEERGVMRGGELAHPLYREVLLQGLRPQRRRELARQALAALEDRPQEAARFLGEAGLEPGQAVRWLDRAAGAAEEAGRPVQAARFRAAAIPLVADPAERGERALTAGRALYFHDLAQATALLETAWAARPGDFAAFKHLCVGLAEAGRGAEADALFEVFPEAERSSLRGFMLRLHVWHHLGRAAQVVELWAASPTLHDQVSPVIARDVAYAKAETGDPAGARALAAQALLRPGLGVLERVVLLEALGYASASAADFAEAERCYDQAIALFEADGQAHRCGSLLFNRSQARHSLGRLAEAVADAERALRLAADGGHALFYAHAQLALGAASLELGRFEQAEELLQECLAHYRQVGLGEWEADAELKLAELYRGWPAPHAALLARKHAAGAQRLAQTLASPRHRSAALTGLALSELRFGEARQALALAEQGQGLALGSGDPMSLCQALRARAAALAALARSPEALADYRRALEIAQARQARLEAARIGLEIAQLGGDWGAARPQLEWLESQGLARPLPHQAPGPAPGPLEPAAVPELRLEVLGPMRALRGGAELPLRGRKRRELLALLLEARLAGRHEVGRLELFEALYPGGDELQAATGLKDMVYQVRELCGPQAVQTTEGGYALGEVATDAEEFLRGGETRLWRGPYLESLGLDLGGSVREALHLALRGRAEALLEADPAEAARLGQTLLESDPYALEHLHLTLAALRAAKNHKALTRAYARARQRMSEVGERLPEGWAEFLARPSGVVRSGL